MQLGDGPAVADARAHVVLESIDVLVLPKEDHHHLARVLRLRGGDPVTVTDGRGCWRRCVVPVGWPETDHLEPVGEVQRLTRRAEPVTVAFALTKNDKPELVVQKLTELGVDRIVPFVAKRSVVQWDAEKSARNVIRWRAIAREAVQQSRQAFLPDVSDVRTVAELVSEGGFCRADRGGQPIGATSCRSIAVGPEGGWDPTEREILFPAVELGPTVLRAETAALTAGVLLTLRS